MTADNKPQLASLIQRKGAPRPREMPQRGTEPAPPAALPPETSGRIRALTLKLSEVDYRRLRLFAAQADRTHQEILTAALREYLDRTAGG